MAVRPTIAVPEPLAAEVEAWRVKLDESRSMFYVRAALARIQKLNDGGPTVVEVEPEPAAEPAAEPEPQRVECGACGDLVPPSWLTQPHRVNGGQLCDGVQA